MTKTLNNWEEEFEMQFNQPHPSNWHALANDGKRSSDCETCKKQGRYSLTFLTEGSYWNREIFEDVKSFIRSLLSQQRADFRKMVEGKKEERVKITNKCECGRPMHLPDRYSDGYNQALADLLNSLDEYGTE